MIRASYLHHDLNLLVRSVHLVISGIIRQVLFHLQFKKVCQKKFVA